METRETCYRNKGVVKYLLAPIFVTLMALLGACSTANQDSPFALVDPSGNHPEGWIEDHGSFAYPDGSMCFDCHGEGLEGGISKVSCSSASYNGQACHANGPGFHPDDWLDKNSTGSHRYGYLSDPSACRLCHDVSQPDTPPGYNCLDCHFSEDGTARVPDGSSYSHGDTTGHSSFTGSEAAVCVACHEVNNRFGYDPSCHNCHDSHEVPYLNHQDLASDSGLFTSLCSACHSIDGASPSAAPLCVSCHEQGSPYVLTNCRSCHGRPPSTGEHGQHSGASCDACHLGAGSGSGLNHFYDGEVDVVFSVSNFTYSAGRCTGTCHIGDEDESHSNRAW